MSVVPTSGENIGARVAAVLGSEDRQKFLAYMAYELAIASRAAYPHVSDLGPEVAARRMCCVNEVLEALASQLMKDATGSGGYRDDVFAESLLNKASIYGDDVGVRHAIERALTKSRT